MPDPVPLPLPTTARPPPPPRALSADLEPGRPLRARRDRYLRVGSRNIPYAVLAEIRRFTDYDADGSQAKAAFLRLVNTGHLVTVTGADGTPLPDSEVRLNALATRAWALGGGGTDKLIVALLARVFCEGGAGIEVELDSTLTDVVDLHPFGRHDFLFRAWTNPATERTSIEKFPIMLNALAGGQPVPALQTPYQGLDVEGEENPYGMPPLLAALDALEDLATFTEETLRVIHTQGYGRPHITVDHLAITSMRPDLQGDALTAFLEDMLGQIRGQLESLDPDQAFITYDYITSNVTPPGDLGSSNAGIKDELVRRVVTALKTIAVILGQNEGSTTTHATVQWQIYAKLLEEAQRLIQRLLEAAYNTCLRVWGLPGQAHVAFEPIRQTDRTVEAAADATEQANLQRLHHDGLISHAEYSQATVGHDPAGDPPPTAREEFELQEATAQLKASVSGATSGAQLPQAPPPDPNAPGSDAGLTAEEGAALDQALGSNSFYRQWADAPTVPELGADAAAVIGAEAADDVRTWVRNEAPGLLALLDAEAAS
jgi:hypothetical protein